MRIILTQDIHNLGLAGDITSVANGYGRNYLIPKKMALRATAGNEKRIEIIKKIAEQKKLKEFENLKSIAGSLDGKQIDFVRKTDEKGHLFGSVTQEDITRYFLKDGVNIHRSMVKMESHIKEIGEYKIPLHLTGDVEANLKVVVKSESFEELIEEEEEVEEKEVEENQTQKLEVEKEKME